MLRLGQQEADGVWLGVADKIGDALGAEVGDLALFPHGEFVPGGLGKNGVEIVAEAAVKDVDAGSTMGFPLDQKMDGLVAQRKFHSRDHSSERAAGNMSE